MFAASKSSPTTWKCRAQHAAVTLPRCQRPRTVTFILIVTARFVHPLVLLQPLEGAANALLDRQRRLPTGGANLFRVQENERVVPHPAAIAAGVLKRRLQF